MKGMENFRVISTHTFHDEIVRFHRIMQTTDLFPVLYGEGEPGMGKTSVAWSAARTIAAEDGLEVVESPSPTDDEFGMVVIHLGNIGEEVMAGLPWVDKDTSTLHRAVDALWPRRGRGILLLDEPFHVGYAQRFFAQLCSERRIGEVVLPEGWQVMACGNSAEHRAGAQRVYTHTQNRICQVRVKSSSVLATEHFVDPVTPEVGVYLRWFGDSTADLPGKLTQFDATKSGPYATARVWDYLNTLIVNGMNPTEHFHVFQGYIGYDAALDYKTYYEAISLLPDLDDMLENPDAYSETMKAMGVNNPGAVAAFASVMLRRYDSDRDIESAGVGIKLIAFARSEHVASYVALAHEIDKRAKDGMSIYDHAEWTKFTLDHPHLLT